MVVVYCCKLRLIELPTLSTPPNIRVAWILKKSLVLFSPAATKRFRARIYN